MKKNIAIILALVMLLGTLSGCAGTTVVYGDLCTCPAGSHETTEAPTTQTPPTEGTPVNEDDAVKTGLAIVAGIGDSTAATAEAAGAAVYDVTVVAVTVDDEGVIRSCIIDSLGTTVNFDTNGAITTDLETVPLTKTELGDDYGMKAYAGATYEWYEQAAALADYAEGKTLDELKKGAVDETGHAVDADLATTATIYLGGYVSAIEAAVANAQHLGAKAEDELRLAVIPSLSSSASATAEAAGTAQLDLDATALTMSGETITSCMIDALQAKVSFDTAGAITTDLTVAPQTKNQLGEGYGMKAYAGATYEWNEQAAFFAQYVTGKTAADIAGMAVSDGKPAEADLATTVTISVGGFQALIAKATR